MSTLDRVTTLSQRLDERAAIIASNELYLTGRQPLAFLSSTARDAVKLSRMASNIPAVQVTAIAERLRVVGLTLDGKTSPDLWSDWQSNDMDQLAGLAFREALGLGSSYAIVWDRSGRAEPKVSIESATQVVIETDPGSRETVAAFKRWTSGGKTFATLFTPDAVLSFSADGENAALGWREGARVPNPLGVVPVVEFRNASRLLGQGVSEIEDLKPLVDALNKILADMMVGSEFYSRPRRFATGIEMQTDEDNRPINPFPESDRMMISEQDSAKFGSLPASDLSSYESAVRVILGQIMAVSALPAHYLGALTGQSPGADGLRAAEAALSARAESKQAMFGRPVEAIGRLCQGIRTDTDPDSHEVRVRWADPQTRSIAQEADATVKLHQAGLLPVDFALARIGFDADQIAEIRTARRIEALTQPRGLTP